MSTTPPDSDRAGPRFTWDAMACRFGLYLTGVETDYARRCARAACDEIDRLELLLSRHIAHSEISQLNRARPGEWVPVSPETVACLQIAVAAYAETGGAFDVAYRSRPRAPRQPDGTPLTPLLYDPARRAIGVQYEQVDLDLGAIGKGFALDCVAAVVREWQIPGALLDSGQSTVLALGTPPDGSTWHVQLRGPNDVSVPFSPIALHEQALSGSGQILHGPHIVDPHAGTPVAAARAAWAIAPSAALSDALSTAFMIMAPADIAALCARRSDITALLHVPDEAGASAWLRYP